MSSPSADYLFSTIRSVERRAAGLMEIARFVRASGDLHDLLNGLLVKTAEMADADAGVVALADKTGSGGFQFVTAHWAGLSGVEASQKEKLLQVIRLNLSDGIIGQVYGSGEPQVVADLSQNSAFRKDVADVVGYQIKNLLAVPMQIDEDRLGVIELFNKRPDGSAFGQEDLDLLTALANQIALVVEAHRLREKGGGEESRKAAEAAREEARRLGEELQGVRRALDEAERRTKELEGQAGTAKESRSGLEKAEARARALESEKEASRGALEKAEGRVRELESALEEARKAEARVRELEAEREPSRAALEKADARGRELESEAAKAREAAEKAEQRTKSLQEELVQTLDDAEQRTRDIRQELDAAKGVISHADARVRQLTEDLEKASRRREAAEAKSGELERELESRVKDSRSREQQALLMQAMSAVSSDQPMETMLDMLLGASAALLEAEAASLLLVDDETGRLFFAAATGVRKDPLKKILLEEGEGIAGWVAKNGKTLIIPDVVRDPRFSEKTDSKASFTTRSVLAVPLHSEGRLIGVAEAVNKKEPGAFSEDDAQTLMGLALYGAMAIRKAQIYWDMNDLFNATIEALADAIEAKGPGGRGRAERIRRLALSLAQEKGAPQESMRDLEVAALLHDVGKVGVPESLGRKTDGFTEDELKLLARVPLLGSEILSPVKPMAGVVPLVRHVHERWDGEGYPDRLAGEDIPLGARIIAVAQAYEAMVSDRPYRRRLPEDVAVKEIKSLSGAQLDPACVDALVRLYRKGRLKDLFK